MINQDRMVKEFIELVQIDSLSRQERQMADALKVKLAELGLTVTEDQAGKPINGTAGNVVGKLAGSIPGAPVMLFAAHMDRVTPGNGIKPVIKGDTIYSDGTTILAADDIAGVVQILEAIRFLKENNVAHGDVEVLFTISEEGGLFGAKGLDRSSVKAEMGFFLDGGGDVGTIIPQAPAQTKINVTMKGKSAHAGIEPENGINAIQVVSSAIANMKIGRIDAETTANIGTISGGLATNIVCEQVEIRCEARSRNQQKLEAQVKHMVDEFEKAARRFGATAEIDVEQSYPAMNLTEADPIVDLTIAAVKRMGLTPTLTPTGGGSDGNILNGKGLPSIVLGIGMENVHGKSESIKIEQLVNGAKLVVAIVEEAASRA